LNKKSSIWNKLVTLEKKLFRKHIKKIIRFFGVLIVAGIIVNVFFSDWSYFKPSKTKEFAKTSVMVLGPSYRRGGSGVILQSTPTHSIILTNNHICNLVKNGGHILRNARSYPVKAIKRSKEHDLCLMKTMSSFGVNTKIADVPPEKYSDAVISGHPNLLPHVLTKGNFSGYMIITLRIGKRKCTKGLICALNGGYLLMTKVYETQLVTGLILPGSSGSAVYNDNGEISGLVFAGNGGRGMGYAFIVPYSYVANFVNNEAKNLKWIDVKIGGRSNKSGPNIFIPRDMDDLIENI